MPAKILLLALLLGSAGGGLTAWALSANHDVVAGTTGVRHRAEGVPSDAAAPCAQADAREGPALRGRPGPDRAVVTGPDATGGQLARLDARMVELGQRIDALEEELHPVDLDALSEEELETRAATLYAFQNYAGTLETYTALLARDPDLDPLERSKVLITVAQCYRALGNVEQAEKAFLQVEALHGEGSAGAMTARYQRAWLRHARNDVAGARAFMRQVAASPSSPRFWKLFSRANAADFSIQLGETAGVRADLEEFRSDLAGDESQTGRRVLAYVNQLLERLDSSDR